MIRRALTTLALITAVHGSVFAQEEVIESEKVDHSPAVAAARAQAATFEKDGFIFREDHWESTITEEKGKGVRIQLFKGHEYRICVAAAPGTKAKIKSHVVGADMKPIENENVTSEDGSSVNLRVSPDKTGVHVILVSQKGAPEVQCALVIGYR